MNFGKIQRAANRHKYMQDYPAYSDFLNYIHKFDYVWKVSQSELAEWWERRQSVKIKLEIMARGRLHVSCPLDGSVIEVDGKDLRIPPFDIPVSMELPIGTVNVTCSDEECVDKAFFDEIVGHLGYGHIEAGLRSGEATRSIKSIEPILKRLRKNAFEHWRYEQNDVGDLRKEIADVHHEKGIPELRLWTLPHITGKIQRVCVSVRYDVDKAIVNLPFIHELEEAYNLRSTVYLRPSGYFYGRSDIQNYIDDHDQHEVALHGEFVTTAENRSTDEFTAAREEKILLEKYIGREVKGVCMHGGELRANYTKRTWRAIESAGFMYETLYRNKYYLPLHLPCDTGIRKTLSIGQHYADISTKADKECKRELTNNFIECFLEAYAAGGVFILVMHPIYFSIKKYIKHPKNVWRLAKFIPRYASSLIRMKSTQEYLNVDD